MRFLDPMTPSYPSGHGRHSRRGASNDLEVLVEEKGDDNGARGAHHQASVSGSSEA